VLLVLEVVKQIREAEIRADDIKRSAQERANEVIRNAKKQAEDFIDDAQKKAGAIASEIMIKYEKEADEQVRQIAESNTANISQIKQVPNDETEKAVNLIIERIVGSRGNS
jgi:V/A-type H+-transporting ATPase subunit G/H